VRSRTMPDKGFRVPVSIRWGGLSQHILLAIVAFIVLLVQVTHPGLHPLEVINPDAGTHVACPFSHAAGDLLIIFLLPALASLILWPILEPHPWPGRLYFDHHLAPRPPPTFPL
jgi:hypothetical protein